ncbi:hypothetical protein H310_12686 [Aphanomyces invadans]|uniref:VHS domain-containing protein n=1 Tax=Aphanomyces invadans TaxID=157072 RepID=A0A024TGW4_9STRA|nr:hypothetical protein H310_12686 [Aphanomyces invadans]ETV93249.1 hypothetical protein H310_12686 [Aphanomyces invadans]|eukprot:XP_008878084.1 hypothetical protein H310_12686 [Aphanomyces invadans]
MRCARQRRKRSWMDLRSLSTTPRPTIRRPNRGRRSWPLSTSSIHSRTTKYAFPFTSFRTVTPSCAVVLSALHLTEAIVKNCGKSIRTRIAHPKFMSTMELLYKEHRGKVGQSHLLICERVLELIQGWGEAFLPHRRELPGFSDTYHKMCKEGVPFPAQYDASRAPVLSPPRNGTGVPGIPGTEVHVPPAARPSEPNSFRSLGPDETFHVTNNVLEMVEDMLAESAKSNHVEVLENDILHDLHGQLVQLQQHLLVVIEREASSGSENLDKLLTLNDAIQAAHNMFVAATSSQVASSPRRKHKPDRDEAEDNAVMSPKKAPRGADVMSKANVPDDDPFAAFAQERVRKQQSVVLNTAESTHPVPVAAASDAPVAAPAVVVQDLISWDDRDEVVARAACGVMAGHAPPPRNPFDAFVLAVPPPRRTTSTNPFDLI